jgi:hypothetical protein
VNNIGSSVSIFIGILFLAGGLANHLLLVVEPDRFSHFSSASFSTVDLGVYLVLGGLAFRSSKTRRHNAESANLIRIILELEAIAIILFLLFHEGTPALSGQLVEGLLVQLVGIGALVFWIVSCLLPKKILPSKLLIRAGIYCAEGIEFRMYSSGRILVSKSDLKPLDDAGTDFQSIGWFLRAYPDIDMNGIRRIGD